MKTNLKLGLHRDGRGYSVFLIFLQDSVKWHDNVVFAQQIKLFWATWRKNQIDRSCHLAALAINKSRHMVVTRTNFEW